MLPGNNGMDNFNKFKGLISHSMMEKNNDRKEKDKKEYPDPFKKEDKHIFTSNSIKFNKLN